jgi:signal transduction histidine kinase
MLVILFISLVILYINAHTTVLDIESLTNKIKSITIDNISKVDIETFKKVSRDDEIGILNESYIQMLIQLNQYSHEMESIIKIRTEQLSYANKELGVALEEVNVQKEMLEKNNSRLKESIKENKLMLQELSESKKMAALGSVVKGVAHEINTPLGNAVTTISYASSIIDKINSKLNDNKLGKDELDKYLIHLIEANQVVETNLSMIVNLIKNFKQLIGTENSHMIEVNMNDYVTNVLESYRNTSKLHYSFHVTCVEDVNMKLPLADMTLVLNNLISNSILHCEVSNLIIVVEIKVEDKQVKLFYRDNGTGIESSVQKEMFEPFFTTKRNEGHTGLGLHIVFNVLNHNIMGKIKYKDGFEITLYRS